MIYQLDAIFICVEAAKPLRSTPAARTPFGREPNGSQASWPVRAGNAISFGISRFAPIFFIFLFINES